MRLEYPNDMYTTSRWVGLFGILFSTLVLGGCGDDPECAIDTDCPIFQRCTTDHRCVRIGSPEAGVDAGEGGMDAGVDAEAGIDDADVPDAEPRGVGTVRVTATGTSATAMASFGGTGSSISCATESFGSCDVHVCTRELPSTPDAGVDAGADAEAGMPDAEVYPHAEAITISGTAGDILLLEDPVGIYPPATGTTPWTAETPAVMISGAGGGGVDAFDLLIDGPSPIVIVDPPGLESITSLTAGTNFDFSWTGASSGSIRLELVRSDWMADETTQRSLVCRFALDPADAMGGSGVVQGALLNMLPTGLPYRLTIRTESRQETMVDGWVVRGVADSVVTTSTGASFNGSTLTVAAP